MPGIPHTHFPRGKRVWVILKDGTAFVAKFDETNDHGAVSFLDHKRVRTRDLRSITYYNPLRHKERL
jgi:hypothetical protein